MDLFFIILIIISIVVIALHSYSINKKNIFVPVYYFLSGCLYVYVIQYLTYRNILLNYFGEEHVLFSMFIVWISILIFYAGYRSVLTKRLAKKLPIPIKDWPRGVFLNYGFFLVFIAIVGSYIFIIQSGGIEEFFSAPRGKGAYESSTAYI